MVHKMRLVDFAFKAIKNKEKDIEIRLNDEKRQLIRVGDIIEFEHIDTKEVIKTKGVNLYKFKTFKELFDKFPSNRLGVSEDYTIIGVLSTGDPVLCQNGSEKISIYDHETGKMRDDEVYSDFFKFLENLLSILGIE